MLRISSQNNQTDPSPTARYGRVETPQDNAREPIPTPREILKQTADALERTLYAPGPRSEWFLG